MQRAKELMKAAQTPQTPPVSPSLGWWRPVDQRLQRGESGVKLPVAVWYEVVCCGVRYLFDAKTFAWIDRAWVAANVSPRDASSREEVTVVVTSRYYPDLVSPGRISSREVAAPPAETATADAAGDGDVPPPTPLPVLAIIQAAQSPNFSTVLIGYSSAAGDGGVTSVVPPCWGPVALTTPYDWLADPDRHLPPIIAGAIGIDAAKRFVAARRDLPRLERSTTSPSVFAAMRSK